MSLAISNSACFGTSWAQAGAEAEQLQWYALHVRARHEKRVAEELLAKRFEVFLPTRIQISRWTDRQKRVELPLFPCYGFVRMVLTPESRVFVLRGGGILGFVGPAHQATPIPDEEIGSVRRLVEHGTAISAHPYCQIGQRVRVRGGTLEGMEGILSEVNGARRLVLSVETVQRSVSVSLEGYDIEPA
jgi:transcription antitermination factor NusG